MNHPTHFQIWLGILVAMKKIQTIHLQSLLQRKKMILLNLMNMISQSYQYMLQREHPNIPFVALEDSPIASDNISVADSYNPDEPDHENLHQSKHIWEW